MFHSIVKCEGCGLSWLGRLSRKVKVAHLCLTLCDLMDCIAHQAPLSVAFSRQKYWSGQPFPSLGDLPDPGIELESLAFQAGSLPAELPEKPQKIRVLEKNHELYLHPKQFPVSVLKLFHLTRTSFYQHTPYCHYKKANFIFLIN